LGIAANSKKPFVDAILGLDEQVQTTLIEVMQKYVYKADAQPENMEKDLIETLLAQIKQKDLEHNNVLQHLKKVEEENEEMTKRLSDLKRMHKKEVEEKQEEAEYSNKNSYSLHSPTQFQRERELAEEADNLDRELSILKSTMATLEKEKDSQIQKLKEELEDTKIYQEQVKELTVQINKYKKKADELMEDNKDMAEQLEKMETLQYQVIENEKSRKNIEEEKNKLIGELYNEKSNSGRIAGELKKLKNEYAILEKDNKLLNEKYKFAECQAKSAEEALENYKEEYEMQMNTKSLYGLEEEAKYKEEVNKLKLEIGQLRNISEETSKSKLMELEAMLNNMTLEKNKLQEEVQVAYSRTTKLESENEELKSQMLVFQKGNKAIEAHIKEYQRVKRDKDTLLELAKRAQDSLEELDRLKKTNAQLETENEQLKKQVEVLEREKSNKESELNNLKEKNVQITKKLTRAEERIKILEEAKVRYEGVYKEVQDKKELIFGQKLEEELLKQKELKKQKYKAKLQKLTVSYSNIH